MNYLILIPSSFEFSFINVDQTKKNIKTTLSGIGYKTTNTIKKILNSKSYKFSSVVLIGFAGGINMKNNQVFSINKTINEKEEIINIDTLKLSKVYKTNSILTVRKPIHSLNRKNAFIQKTKLIDMETFFLAKFCKFNNINFYSFRIVLDDCSKDLKPMFLGKEKPSEEILKIGEKLNLLYYELINLI